MRIIKLAIISIIFLFAVVTVISLFIPSNIRISKAIQIKATREDVWPKLSDPAEWRTWYPGQNSAELFHDSGKINGIRLDKNSDQALVIKNISGDEVKAEFIGLRRNMRTGWKLMPAQGSVTVQWYMDFKLRWYPWEKFSSLLFEKMYGPQMEKGLTDLKAIVETKPLVQ